MNGVKKRAKSFEINHKKTGNKIGDFFIVTEKVVKIEESPRKSLQLHFIHSARVTTVGKFAQSI